MKLNLKKTTVLLALLVTWYGCQKNEIEPVTETKSLVADFNIDAIWEWNEMYLRIDKDALGYRPNPSPRVLAYLGLSAYEIAVPGMPAFKSLRNQFGPELKLPAFPADKKIYWPAALNSGYGLLMSHFFSKTRFLGGFNHLSNEDTQLLIESLENGLESKYKLVNDPIVMNDSKAWGKAVAQAVWDWAKTDPYGQDADLNPFSNDASKPDFYNWRSKGQDQAGKLIPGIWRPTNDNPDAALFPFAGRFRTFVTSESQKLCAPPLPYSESKTSPFYAQALEVYSLSNADMPYEDRWVSEFWSDDIEGQTFSPPARIIAILDELLVNEKSTLEKAVEAVAKLGIGLNDFAVNSWHSKYVYNVERPETYIQRLIDPKWETLLKNTITGATGLTPPFPAYPSGHSTFAGGSAVLLAELFGSNYNFTDLCHKNRFEFIGTPRTYNSLEEAMFENAFSRITLGVHYRMDCTAGFTLGQQTARRVLKLPWKS